MSDDRTESRLSVAAAELLSQAQAKAAELQANLDASREHADAQYRRAEQLQKKVDALTAPADPESEDWPELIEQPDPPANSIQAAIELQNGINALLAHARQCQARIETLESHVYGGGGLQEQITAAQYEITGAGGIAARLGALESNLESNTELSGQLAVLRERIEDLEGKMERGNNADE